MNSEKKFNVVIIGAGPSGIGAAIGLSKNGIKSVLLIERNNEIGGIPSIYKKKSGGVRTFINWIKGRIVFGEDYAKWLQQRLDKTDVKIWTKSKVIEINPEAKKITVVNSENGKINITADVFILACGARENTQVELGWLSGSRVGRTFFSKNLIELMDHHNTLPMNNAVIVGSDLNAYAIATKLKTMGAKNLTILDTTSRPKSPLYARLYFRLWKSSPKFFGGIKSARFIGNSAASAIELDNGVIISCDGIVLSGDLIPNSELALLAHLAVNIPSRKPVVDSSCQLSEPGWFATGNILGGFHSAEWCYFSGKSVAKKVAGYLEKI